ncbi:hypothetical protein CHUAL_002638 [Chamberlinius hualienensis]
MTPKYRLIYFNGRGLCESIRLILAYTGQEYIDDRVDAEQWAKMKTAMFMRLPILKFDGVILAESRAICRYLAREHDLVGNNNIDAATCDMLVDEFYDIYPQLNKWRRDDISDKMKAVLIKEFIAGPYDEFLKRFNIILSTRHKSFQSSFLVCDKITWADIVIANGFDELVKLLDPHIDKGFYDTPGRLYIPEFIEQVLSTPSIKVWIDKRPKTPF